MSNELFLSQNEGRRKKDERQRLAYYVEWLANTNRLWYSPDLDAYRDYLLTERHLKSGSVATHLSAVRSRYRALLESDELDATLKSLAQPNSKIDEFVAAAKSNLWAATRTEAGHIEVRRNRANFYRLSPREIDELLAQPYIRMNEGNIGTKQSLRDTTAIGLMLCTGIDEAELCVLQASDLDTMNSMETILHVPQVPAGIERYVPLWDAALFDRAWLTKYLAALQRVLKTDEGPLFRGFFRGGNAVSSKPLTARGTQRILQSYAFRDDRGETRTVTALDLRRTLARQLFKIGIEVEEIQAHLGHRSSGTTLEYIGPPDIGSDGQTYLKSDGNILHDRLNQTWRREG